MGEQFCSAAGMVRTREANRSVCVCVCVKLASSQQPRASVQSSMCGARLAKRGSRCATVEVPYLLVLARGTRHTDFIRRSPRGGRILAFGTRGAQAPAAPRLEEPGAAWRAHGHVPILNPLQTRPAQRAATTVHDAAGAARLSHSHIGTTGRALQCALQAVRRR